MTYVQAIIGYNKKTDAKDIELQLAASPIPPPYFVDAAEISHVAAQQLAGEPLPDNCDYFIEVFTEE